MHARHPGSPGARWLRRDLPQRHAAAGAAVCWTDWIQKKAPPASRHWARLSTMVRVQTGCRDCELCTGHAFTGFGRTWGRAGADVASLGITALARRKCKGCGHPMSEHHAQAQQVVVVQQQPPAPALPPAPVPPPALPPAPVPPPGWSPAGWRQDPTDAACVCWWDGYRWHPQTKRPK